MTLLNPRIPISLRPAKGLRALIFDWAGTTVDFGSLAPVRTLQQVFTRFEVPVSEEQARRDMGIAKRDHIARILAIPDVAEAWQKHYSYAPREADIDEIYTQFIPLQFACLAEYSAVIPGVVEAVARARARHLKIGSTTGYTRAMLDLLLQQGSAAGYQPDCSLSPEDVGSGRPHPFMMFEAARRLNVYPLSAIVKIGDTPADVEEGLNAGAWSIGVAQTGNMIGLSEGDWNALPLAEQTRRLATARGALKSAGAHFVIDGLAELDPVLDEIERLLQ